MINTPKSRRGYKATGKSGSTVDPPKDKYVNGVYTAAVKKPEGVRYYQGTSSDQSIAQKKALSKSRISPADSVSNPNINKARIK